MHSLRRWLSLGVTAGLIGAVFLWAFGGPGGGAAPPESAVPLAGRPYSGPLAVAELQSVVPVTETVGTIQAREKAVVASELLAGVRAVHVAAGDGVQAGALVVELDDRDERTRVQQAGETVNSAQASLEEAARDVQRFEDLFRQHAATQRDLDQARTRLAVAQAEVARAKEAHREAEVTLSLTRIRAPVSGVVVDKLVDPGDLAAPGKPLLSIYNPNLLRLEVDVRTALLPRLHVGDRVSVYIDDVAKTIDGVVGEIVPTADVASRSVRVKVDLPAEPGLYVGMFGRLRTDLDAQEQLMVPLTAIRRVGQLTMVDVVVDGRASRRLVTLGRVTGDRVRALSGLEPDEQVALE